MVKLSASAQKFILHWGEMGPKWGINRTVAQIHALLFLSEQPLNAEDIAETLFIARSNVSTSLRELQGWGIVKVVQKLGDRRDYFESLGDVWELFRIIADERRKREADPTLTALRECATQAAGDPESSEHERQRLVAMQEFFETMMTFYEHASKIPTSVMVKFLRMGERIRQIVSLAAK